MICLYVTLLAGTTEAIRTDSNSLTCTELISLCSEVDRLSFLHIRYSLQAPHWLPIRQCVAYMLATKTAPPHELRRDMHSPLYNCGGSAGTTKQFEPCTFKLWRGQGVQVKM